APKSLSGSSSSDWDSTRNPMSMVTDVTAPSARCKMAWRSRSCRCRRRSRGSRPPCGSG
uniref:Uncharacterized protein n=1 Tax=Oryza brachyantha TaxID=4533 RepID=J3MH80_ORYBR